MAISLETLLDEAKCFCPAGGSTAERTIMTLLQRIAEAGDSGGGTPGAPLNSVQFNDGGGFGGDADFAWNKTTNLLSITGGIALAGEANETQLAITGYSLTGAASNRMVNLAGTWNTTGAPVALQIAITDTASAATAKFLEFAGGAGGGTSMFSVDKLGRTTTSLVTIPANANENAIAVTGYSLTAANAQSMVSMAGVLNTTGNPVAIRLALTNTASGGTTKFMQFFAGAAGATSIMDFGISGSITTLTAFIISADSSVLASGVLRLGTDTNLNRDAANVFGQRNGVTAQAFRVYRTFTDASNYERLALQTAAGQMIVAAETAGTGTDDLDLVLTPAGTGNVTLPGSTTLLKTLVALTDNAGAGLGTLSNAPTAGNPTKWIRINDAGTARFVPSWT